MIYLPMLSQFIDFRMSLYKFWLYESYSLQHLKLTRQKQRSLHLIAAGEGPY